MQESETPILSDMAVYRWMALCRVLDEALCTVNPRWFPCEGEEATILGSFYDCRPEDIVAPHYRDPFIVYILRGAELWRLVAQVIGKPAGYSRGRAVPFTGPIAMGIVPWVAGDLGTSLGIATGAAFALQENGAGGICVCTFGDGTANRGDFHENIVLAAAWRLPIVYICQNNGWAISQRHHGYLPAPIIARAAGYGIPGIAVDGQDIDAVRDAVRAAAARARAGDGPTLIEARTLRMRGHWAGDNVSYRTDADRDAGEDPLELLAARLLERGDATHTDLIEARTTAEITVAEAMERAKASPDVIAADLAVEEVYA
jgi:acetoin:2,6-dichlorophenolindophenol oxidoreductase subunit alpha